MNNFFFFFHTKILRPENWSSSYFRSIRNRRYNMTNHLYFYSIQDLRKHLAPEAGDASHVINDYLSLQRQQYTSDRQLGNRHKSADAKSVRNIQCSKKNYEHKPSSETRYIKNFGCYDQSHGIVSASVYRDLRNGTIGW